MATTLPSVRHRPSAQLGQRQRATAASFCTFRRQQQPHFVLQRPLAPQQLQRAALLSVTAMSVAARAQQSVSGRMAELKQQGRCAWTPAGSLGFGYIPESEPLPTRQVLFKTGFRPLSVQDGIYPLLGGV